MTGFRLLSFSLALALMILGCGYFHQPGLTVEFVNQSDSTLRNVEIDFPGGTFGMPSLPPGGRATRWMKITGSGPLKSAYFDSAGEHRLDAINLAGGDSGAIEVDFQNGGQVAVLDHRRRR